MSRVPGISVGSGAGPAGVVPAIAGAAAPAVIGGVFGGGLDFGRRPGGAAAGGGRVGAGVPSLWRGRGLSGRAVSSVIFGSRRSTLSGSWVMSTPGQLVSGLSDGLAGARGFAVGWCAVGVCGAGFFGSGFWDGGAWCWWWVGCWWWLGVLLFWCGGVVVVGGFVCSACASRAADLLGFARAVCVLVVARAAWLRPESYSSASGHVCVGTRFASS